MTLDELESIQPPPKGDDEDVCQIECKVVKEEEEEVDPNLKKVVDKIFAHFCGKSSLEDSRKPAIQKSKKTVMGIIHRGMNLHQMSELDDDLWETLDLLQTAMRLFARLKDSIPHSMGPTISEHMEEMTDHLEQWGLGDTEDKLPPFQLTSGGITEVELADLMKGKKDEMKLPRD